MRVIKFRARSAESGEMIYGIGVKKYPEYLALILDDLFCERIYPESLSQFVGYDKRGKEIYERDPIFANDDKDHRFYKKICLCVCRFDMLDEYIIGEIGDKFKNLEFDKNWTW